jgi:hypothetical protein
VNSEKSKNKKYHHPEGPKLQIAQKAKIQSLYYDEILRFGVLAAKK